MIDLSKLPKSTLDALSAALAAGSPGVLRYTGLRFSAGGATLAELVDATLWTSLSFVLADVGDGSRWYLDQSQDLHAIDGVTLSTEAALRIPRSIAIARDPRAEMFTVHNHPSDGVSGRLLEWKSTRVPIVPAERDPATGYRLIDRSFPDPHASRDGWQWLDEGAQFRQEAA
jgi:hypothetical protein